MKCLSLLFLPLFTLVGLSSTVRAMHHTPSAVRQRGSKHQRVTVVPVNDGLLETFVACTQAKEENDFQPVRLISFENLRLQMHNKWLAGGVMYPHAQKEKVSPLMRVINTIVRLKSKPVTPQPPAQLQHSSASAFRGGRSQQN